MPKWTVKYREAFDLAEQLQIAERDNQDSLYRLLREAGYYWDSGSQTWQQLSQDADPPSDLIKVRVSGESSQIQRIANHLRDGMLVHGYVFLEESEPYPCRPPKQLESRIYLTFK